MSTTVYPYLTAEKLKEAEDESAARELSWLLDSLEETFQALKNGLQECQALLTPVHPGSTLVLSSPRSESIKGHLTRIGCKVVKGVSASLSIKYTYSTLYLRLRTQPPINFSICQGNSETNTTVDGFCISSLTALCTTLNQALNCIDLTHFPLTAADPATTASNAAFVLSQLRILYSLFQDSLSILKGSNSNQPPNTLTSPPPHQPKALHIDSLESVYFTPELPSSLALELNISDCCLLLTIRVLESCSQQLTIGSRFLTGIGVQRRLEHDEMNNEYLYRGEAVRVKEKYRVESSADPCLLSFAAKLQALERSVLGAMEALKALTNYKEEELGT